MTTRIVVGEKHGGTGARSARKPKKRRSRRVVRVARDQGEEEDPHKEEEDDVPAFGRCCVCNSVGWFACSCEECGSETGAVCVDPYWGT